MRMFEGQGGIVCQPNCFHDNIAGRTSTWRMKQNLDQANISEMVSPRKSCNCSKLWIWIRHQGSYVSNILRLLKLPLREFQILRQDIRAGPRYIYVNQTATLELIRSMEHHKSSCTHVIGIDGWVVPEWRYFVLCGVMDAWYKGDPSKLEETRRGKW